MRKPKTIKKVWNWLRPNKGVETGERRTREGEPKVLTVANTVETKLTDYFPRMTMPEGQQDLVDWGALEPCPVLKPDKHTGLHNWPKAGDDE